MTTVVRDIPFKTRKKELAFGEFLALSIEHLEKIEDAFFLAQVREGDKSEGVSTKEFYSAIDKKIAGK